MATSQIEAQLIAGLQATWSTDCVAFVASTLTIWDHVITFGEEVKLFWNRNWSSSKVLYLSIRYLALVLSSLSFYVHNYVLTASSIQSQSQTQYIQLEGSVLHTAYVLVFVLVLLCQAAVVLRVWYLFSKNNMIRIGAVLLYCGSIVGSSILGAQEWNEVYQEFVQDTSISSQPRLATLWFIFLPCLIVHSVLFMCKIWRVMGSRKSWHDTPVLRRMLKEGAVMYAFGTGSLIWSIIGLGDVSNPSVYQTALLGNLSVAATGISVCRAMLSIGSLAETWHVEPMWLLNHAELSRVHWKSTGNEREIIVQVGDDVDDEDAESESEVQGGMQTALLN